MTSFKLSLITIINSNMQILNLTFWIEVIKRNWMRLLQNLIWFELYGAIQTGLIFICCWNYSETKLVIVVKLLGMKSGSRQDYLARSICSFGAKMIFTNDFVHFNKGYVRSMADAVGEKSLLCVSHENHKRIRRLLSDPFSTNSLAEFVQKFDKMLCQRLKKLEKERKSFVVLDFSMKVMITKLLQQTNIMIYL